jgi:hypothetical protein
MWLLPDIPPPADEVGAPRAANHRLREVIEAKDRTTIRTPSAQR